MFTAGLLAGKEGTARGTRTRSSPIRRLRQVMEERAQRMRYGEKRMGNAIRAGIARTDDSVILITALLIAHGRPRI